MGRRNARFRNGSRRRLASPIGFFAETDHPSGLSSWGLGGKGALCLSGCRWGGEVAQQARADGKIGGLRGWGRKDLALVPQKAPLGETDPVEAGIDGREAVEAPLEAFVGAAEDAGAVVVGEEPALLVGAQLI